MKMFPIHNRDLHRKMTVEWVRSLGLDPSILRENFVITHYPGGYRATFEQVYGADGKRIPDMPVTIELGENPEFPWVTRFSSDEQLVYEAIAAYPHCLHVSYPCAECAAKIAVATLAAAGRLRDREDSKGAENG